MYASVTFASRCGVLYDKMVYYPPNLEFVPCPCPRDRSGASFEDRLWISSESPIRVRLEGPAAGLSICRPSNFCCEKTRLVLDVPGRIPTSDFSGDKITPFPLERDDLTANRRDACLEYGVCLTNGPASEL